METPDVRQQIVVLDQLADYATDIDCMQRRSTAP